MTTRDCLHRRLAGGFFVLGLVLALAGAACAETFTFTTNTAISISDTTYDNMDIVVQGCTLTVDGAHAFNSLTLERNASNVPGVVTHSPGASGLNLTVTGDVAVQGADGELVASRIDVSGKGSLSETGAGAGGNGTSYGGGAGYGGLGAGGIGGSVGGVAYGSILQPADLGSGGGKGGANLGGPGGGCLRLQAAGVLTLNGTIRADGTTVSHAGGGGAGGSIWLTAGALAGSGLVTADGATPGSANAGSGAGGRIAIYFGTNAFAGAVSAKGGINRIGGAGTIYTRSEAASYGSLLVDNGALSGALTPLTSPEVFNLTISGSAQAYAEAPLVVHNLTVGTGGVLTHITGQTGLDVTVQGTATVDASGAISVAGKGQVSEQGTGAGGNGTSYGGGAGYGGFGAGAIGGSLGGGAYGSILQPVDLGSGGGKGGVSLGGPGGGCLRLQVAGILTVNGSLSADGTTVSVTGGGGSGGSIWLTVGSLAGSGAISADGATPSSANAGSGAGGRIAFYYGTNAFAGAVSAKGGINHVGGAGTIYTRSESASYGSLLVDNGALSGALTPITSPEPFNLTISGSAQAYAEAPLVLHDLRISTDGLLTHITGQTGLDVTVQGTASVDASGAISVSGKGYVSEQGAGAGGNGTSYGGGAGYGGRGAGGIGGSVGGGAYGSILQPVDLGSGGGKGGLSLGGPGGGCLRLQVAGALTVDGSLSADGTTVSSAGGGGSGGSIWLTAGSLAGAGTISADGATPPSANAGSGAGGRIAIYYAASSFAGQVTAYGGTVRVGAPGTVFTKSSLQQVGDLLIDNGGRTGSLTALQFATRYNLTLAGGAKAYATEPLTLASLRVETGATLTHLADQERVDVTVQGDAHIGAAGAISVSGSGYGSGLGPGAGLDGSSYGGGAGYGGIGGAGIGSSGGVEYGSREQPVDRGSGGGKGGTSVGGLGGGAIRLRVNGTLTLDGVMAADGIQGSNTGGGGSGGSIYLTVGTLTGSGTMSAIGGTPPSANAGGGAGGRIAIYFGDMSGFPVSQISVAGGATGARRGGDGTVHLAQVEPPEIAPIGDHYAVTGLPYRGPLPVIVGDSAGVEWDVVAGPSGMTIDETTGEVYWAVPSAAGSPYTVTIQATNAAGSGSESWLLTVIEHPKAAPDGIDLHFGGQVVTAAYPGVFYVEKDDRASGIRVEMAGHELAEGHRADIAGITATNDAGERFIQGVSAVRSNAPGDSGVVEPLGMTVHSVGGSDWFYNSATGFGQVGAAGGTGLNNVGLLVRVFGVVTAVDSSPTPSWFQMDDGTGRNIRCVAPDSSVVIDAGWVGKLAVVTGISSLELDGGNAASMLLLKRYGAPLLY